MMETDWLPNINIELMVLRNEQLGAYYINCFGAISGFCLSDRHKESVGALVVPHMYN